MGRFLNTENGRKLGHYRGGDQHESRGKEVSVVFGGKSIRSLSGSEKSI